ncbi:MAG TPA: sulfotransferase [Bacteroidia bacterium]|jgi:hypothetical protein|nr:sulfotransferase [Bacteroidia bacterium]
MIAIIGSAPSSGSTLLADLIDSSEFSACGEELDLFANKNFYDFNKFKKDPFKNSGTCSIYLNRTYFNTRNFHMYGFNEGMFLQLLEQSKDQQAFLKGLRDVFIKYRSKDKDSVWFEKTPQNINAIEEFLNIFSKSYFIFMVRNPIYVFSSMLKRGISPEFSLVTWFISASKFYRFMGHERTILVKYEELVEKPFQIASSVISKVLGKEILSTVIEEGFLNNSYRKENAPRIKSWGVSDYGVIQNANTKEIEKETIELFCKYKNLKISKGYAKKFGLSTLSFTELIEAYGYSDQINELVKGVKIPDFKFTLQEKKDLYKKWKADLVLGEAKFTDLPKYLAPVTRIG